MHVIVRPELARPNACRARTAHAADPRAIFVRNSAGLSGNSTADLVVARVGVARASVDRSAVITFLTLTVPTMLVPTLFAILAQPAPEGPVAPLAADTEPAIDERRATAWSSERRRLQLHAGLSGGFAGALLLTGTLLLVLPDGCNNENCELNLGRFAAGMAMFPLATIPIGTGIYWGVRLGRHDRERPTAILRPAAGGFVVNF